MILHREIVVSAFRTESRGTVNRVSADVNGVPLWFESSDTELTAAPEAFASALLLASQHRRRRLVIDSPVDRRWVENIPRILARWSNWWGYDVLLPLVETGGDAPLRHTFATALCFSGGVDSFFSLATGPRHDYLVAVHGFDIPLSDTQRMTGLKRSVTAAASSVAATPLIIRTNLRQHPAGGRRRLWERAHGGALAAIGHVLKTSIAQLYVSSTHSTAHDRPWGSSVDTDPLFSSSDLQIIHFGNAPREEKIHALLSHPMVRAHLRVCWENGKPQGNCSRCAKCLVAMLHLAEYGVLHEFTVFEGAGELSMRLDALPYLTTQIAVMQRAVQRGKLEPRLSDAVTRLLTRSMAADRWRGLRARAGNLVDRYV